MNERIKALSIGRGNQLLAALLLVQVVLAAIVFWPHSATESGGEALYPDLDVEQVVRISIRDEQQKEIVLAKQTGSWVLPNAGDYPCLEDKVASFLDGLAELKTGRIVAQTGASHSMLQVASDAYLRQIEFETADGTARRLYLGTAPSYSVTHVRPEGETRVYLVSGLAASDASAQASAWIDTAYVSMNEQDLSTVTLQNGNGTLVLAKVGDAWVLEDLADDETLSETAVSSLIGRLTSARMLAPLGTEPLAEYGMESPNATALLETAQGSKTLHIGAQLDDGSYVLKFSESPYYVRIAEYTASELVEKTREDLLDLPATPEPAS